MAVGGNKRKMHKLGRYAREERIRERTKGETKGD